MTISPPQIRYSDEDEELVQNLSGTQRYAHGFPQKSSWQLTFNQEPGCAFIDSPQLELEQGGPFCASY
eukprot:scaffold3543_cov90-Skeletonema_dohrnii-CCMP3373.AAC.3